MGHNLSDVELELAMKVLDRNGGGRIEYDEFLKWWRTENKFGKLQLNDEQLQALKTASEYFQYFDKDRSGSVDREEFKKLHADLVKNKFTTKSLDLCLQDLDSNNDGKVIKLIVTFSCTHMFARSNSMNILIGWSDSVPFR